VTAALDKLLARNGKTREDLDQVNGASGLGSALREEGVENSRDLERILRIPRRRWEEAEDQEEVVRLMTQWLKRSTGTWSLKPVQARALFELMEYGYLFGPIRVGGGKTLISLLAPRVVDPAPKRPMIIVPADLRDKTKTELEDYRANWVLPPFVVGDAEARDGVCRIESYERISQPQNADLLETLKPDLLIFDECHRLKNKKAAVTRRIGRYLKAHPETRVALMSGTITNRSIQDYAHILGWGLAHQAPQLYPLPHDRRQLSAWSDAIDVAKGEFTRRAPGALEALYDDADAELARTDSLAAVRQAFRRRLVETPGVVATQDGPLGVPLRIFEERLPISDAMVDAFTHVRTYWETVCGYPLADGNLVWKHARELICGFYYVWDPAPPVEWMDARRDWFRFVRETLKHNRRQLDSMGQVEAAVRDGDYPGEGAELLGIWDEIGPTYTPPQKAVWYDDGTINHAAKWLAEWGGIVWVEHRAFGFRLAQETGIPYFSNEGRAETGEEITAWGGKPMICSIASNKTGRNLQAHRHNLVIGSPGRGDAWEQMVGRTHRDGQEAEEVTVAVALPCIEHWGAFEQARVDSKFTQDSTGQAQKLCYAQIDVPTPSQVARRRGPLWVKGN